MMNFRLPLFLVLIMGLMLPVYAQEPLKNSQPRYDLSKDPVLYTVGYAHLDTEWRWDYDETINVFLKNTLDDNFQRFEKFKPYVFTFSGARRYRMMKEYYPAKYEILKKYVAQGRWNVGGSSVDECDANVPSPESVIRQVLYGNRYFEAEFGKKSVDFLLPDCFGFQAHLPSALAHAGVAGFSTQKLSWGSAVGIPFNLGNWTGPDGKGVVAALNATDYTGRIQFRLDTSRYWSDRIQENGRNYGIYADYRYYGVGDVGGAPRLEDVTNAVGSLNQSGSKFQVYLCSSDQLFRDLTPDQKKKLPNYSGDLLLTEHSSGSLTSQAYMKRWNRKNEQLALAAEPVSVMADWLGGLRYPFRTLNEAWWLVLGSQMHDILPGTCIPKAYEYAWNDEVLALNQFASTLQASAGGVIRAMNTMVAGTALVIYNPLAIPRTDVVEAEVIFPDGVPKFLKLLNENDMEIPLQVTGQSRDRVQILFNATLPPFGFVCYDLQPAKEKPAPKTILSISGSKIENELLKVTINGNGDIASIIDKKLGKEILSGPSRLEFHKEHPEYWPAWNMDWNDRKLPPVDYVGGKPVITLVESGPVRVSLKVVRSARNSVVTQYIRLSAGSEKVIVDNHIEWQSCGVSLKACFPLTASGTVATYNLGLGTTERNNNHEKKYEVPSREWFDLTDKTGSFGVSILEDCKFGSDKPDNKTLRLTLLYTPVTNFYHDQATQDWGIHDITYGIYSHKGDWRTGLTEWQGRRLNQPLVAFSARQHPGFLGRSFSFARASAPNVDIRAIKKAENGNDIVIRVQELTGKETGNVEISFTAKVLSAREVDGQEQPLGEAVVRNGKLITDLGKFGIRSFAIRLEPPAEKLKEPMNIKLPIPYDLDVVSSDKNRKNGAFDTKGTSIPGSLFPDVIVVDGVEFVMGPKADGKNNAMTCRGQKIELPKTGNYNHLYLLAAAVTDTIGVFRVGGNKTSLTVQAWDGNIGQFENRRWDKYERISGLDKGYIKRDQVGWFATHLSRDTVNLAHRYGYLYKYSLEAGPASKTLQLPDNPAIRIFAITASDHPYDQVVPVQPLYDDFTGREPLKLVLPASYVDEGMTARIRVSAHRKRKLTDLPARLTMKDYADLHQPNGVTVKYYFTGTDSAFQSPARPASDGNPGIVNGMTVPALNDGMYDLLPSDSLNEKWSEDGEGRILMDLQQEIELDSLHLFVTQNTKRGKQAFSMWGGKGTANQAVTGNPGSAGWDFLGYVQPEDIWGNAKGLYTVKFKKDQPCHYRYLMWISEDSPHGPYYFREVDVFEKQK
ncbi:MAG: glycoside hydrolase family 38 C-terminal domain-containing protein [Bacteroidales bacterium]|nr:glycoside hydrolase family 38 C-terminal domain-containing protein [Bacteroidales bacterium]HNW72452.1 glycoside hydrolase family 38 C-terminal domain-containing protein [Bacteroidales bacterium]HPS50242.1 glycoside hydrolase family 38 C-terminal domain-containing protein [Bacteroidales bacterium]